MSQKENRRTDAGRAFSNCEVNESRSASSISSDSRLKFGHCNFLPQCRFKTKMSSYVEQAVENCKLTDISTKALGVVEKVDTFSQRLSLRIDKELRELCHTGNPSKRRRVTVMRHVLEDLAEKKTTIALRSYDLLDQHIQLVDKEIKLLEMSIRLHGTEIIAQVDSVPVKSSTGRRKGDQNMSRARELLQTIVDPNEPIYCFCRQVAFGNMVACDNEECAIEWFHCSCVNLTKMPKNEWLCPTCSQRRKK